MRAFERGKAGAHAVDAEAQLFQAPGEMCARCRAFDWSSSPLGPVSGWSHALRTTVSIMLESRHPMFLWWGPDLIQIYNDGYLPSFGTRRPHPDPLGARGREYWADIWPVIGPQIDAVMQKGTATWNEDHLVPIERNGRVENVWWTYGYSPVREADGSIGGVLVVVQETTGRVLALAERELLLAAERIARAEVDAARAEMAGVFAQAPVAIAVLQGREMRYSDANPNYRELLGGRDPVGKRLVDMFPDLVGSEIEGILEKVFDTATPFAATNFHLRYNKLGEGERSHYHDLLYHPIVTASGRVERIIAVAVDVTERHDALIEREKLLDLAEGANRAKSQFLAVMSHELRTPLNAIGGHTQLIEMGIHGPVTAEQATALNRIQQSQRHLLGLVNGVLEYTRVEAGAVKYVSTDMDIQELLATCAAMMAPQLKFKGIALRHEATAEQLIAHADAEKTQQIVLNLLSNSLKFTAAAGTITISCSPGAGETVIVTVSDTGIGIPSSELDRIFQPFVQVGLERKHAQEGMGLGLAISRDLARGMGGDLTAMSSPGAGSTFTLALPAARSSRPEP